jgi:hypothetical protein
MPARCTPSHGALPCAAPLGMKEAAQRMTAAARSEHGAQLPPQIPTGHEWHAPVAVELPLHQRGPAWGCKQSMVSTWQPAAHASAQPALCHNAACAAAVKLTYAATASLHASTARRTGRACTRDVASAGDTAVSPGGAGRRVTAAHPRCDVEFTKSGIILKFSELRQCCAAATGRCCCWRLLCPPRGASLRDVTDSACV